MIELDLNAEDVDPDSAMPEQRIYIRNGVVYGLTACVVDPQDRPVSEAEQAVADAEIYADAEAMVLALLAALPKADKLAIARHVKRRGAQGLTILRH